MCHSAVTEGGNGGRGGSCLSAIQSQGGPGNDRFCRVLLVSSSRYPDRWIVPGGGLEPDEEPSAAAAREVCEEAGVKGILGRLLGVFENFERKHRTFVYVLTVTEILEDWEDSVNIGRKRRWFSIEEAVRALQGHKPVQASYFQSLRQSCHPNNGAIPVPSQSALPDIR
ncbi:diphosphoinositol polyphosphate phosphohydrolase 1 isoform X1 [Hyla sarda]|uniref:diphosphoinositol polyphosphate phosphohydrolase 1 isoform X1 n=1 Tax=Hyla sarda TaxID=327740 RepID=UPI0024C3D9DA|nr:diphosphoinositol polyphosphate phosphohydrolase 1 isoform X1 [Hyla sarda]